MSENAAIATRQTAAPEASSKNELKLQRKCACGQHTAGGHECRDCKKKRPKLQRWSADRPAPAAMLHEHVVPAVVGDTDFGFDLSRTRTHTPMLRTAPRLQRAPRDGTSTDLRALEPDGVSITEGVAFPAAPPVPATEGFAPEAPAEAVAKALPSPEAPASAQPATLIADDAATELQPGQLRKADFLDQLHSAVCAEAEAALAGTEHSTEGCPYLAFWFDYYRGQSSEHVESALHRYAPEARTARTAAQYIPLVAARVRQGVERWARTGEITGVPDGMPLGLPGGLGGLVSGIGSLFFKARAGGAQAADDPATVQAELGSGRPLERGVRSRMESAFGQSFAQVRLHTDATARRLSREQNARAFTVGRHVAFGSGEFRPGTMVGDALIAHELAHVVQQGGTSETTQAKAASGASYGALERDADDVAVGAVAALWSGAKGALTGMVQRAMPGLRSGLRLQRCGTTRQATRSRTGAPSTGAGLSCPTVESAAPAPEEGRRRAVDARAQAIINVAQDTSRPIDERAVDVVVRIICQYFPTDAEKVNSVRYVADEPGLGVTTARSGSTIRGDLEVGRYFVENTTERHFARRVLQVRHELQHIDQWRAGMTGAALSNEREFLAFHREALAEALPGTGRMQHSTRVTLIDGALGYYYCLSSEKQGEYRRQRDELLARRPIEERAGGREHTEPPTACQRPP